MLKKNVLPVRLESPLSKKKRLFAELNGKPPKLPLVLMPSTELP